ncbi:MAG: DUF998 domain-containing protein [Candidatus Microbacterium colombiense]|nr:MAG: DUF998 domain-containing protein [Microbacterium sp.]
MTLTAGILLCAGILAATFTTTDPEWWELYFSRLGMTGDLSAALFNGGLILAGIVIAASAVMMRVWLVRSPMYAQAAYRRASHVVPFFVATLGISLGAIGVFPLSVDKTAHDNASLLMLSSFACLLIVHRIFLRTLSRLLNTLAIVSGVLMITSMAAMTMGMINLTLFEAIGFTVILTWVHLLETQLRALSPAVVRERSANSQQFFLSPIWGTSKFALSSIQ